VAAVDAELNQEIETFLQENPLLERDDEEEAPAAASPLIPTTTQPPHPKPSPPRPLQRMNRKTARQAKPTGRSTIATIFQRQDGDEDSEAPQAARNRPSCAIICSTR
jgi:DNA-directed RNA polymerase specialized sigma54-like protein